MFDIRMSDEGPMLDQFCPYLLLSGEHSQESVSDLEVVGGLQGGEGRLSLDFLDHLVH